MVSKSTFNEGLEGSHVIGQKKKADWTSSPAALRHVFEMLEESLPSGMAFSLEQKFVGPLRQRTMGHCGRTRTGRRPSVRDQPPCVDKEGVCWSNSHGHVVYQPKVSAATEAVCGLFVLSPPGALLLPLRGFGSQGWRRWEQLGLIISSKIQMSLIKGVLRSEAEIGALGWKGASGVSGDGWAL